MSLDTRLSIGLRAALPIFAVTLLLMSTYAAAQQETILHNFCNSKDGCEPYAGLIFDGSGNLYGTTVSGGDPGGGIVFELTPPTPPATQWTETKLHNFGNGDDGNSPYGGVIFDSSGNLYGTTTYGGGSATCNEPDSTGCGTAFELIAPISPATHWTETRLRTFDLDEGYWPEAGLIFDSSGNLYGTTNEGGDKGSCYGTVFELIAPISPATHWTTEQLVNICGANGGFPTSSLIFDTSGNLYGTTLSEGAHGYGNVFELTPPTPPATHWTEKILHSFKDNGTDGVYPHAGLILDSSGNLYGTTLGGGAYSSAGCMIISFSGSGCGTVFELTPPIPPATQWTETILHSFDLNGVDGVSPYASLIFDSSGNLYGTTETGGAYNSGRCEGNNNNEGCGTVFELTPPTPPATQWMETILHSFNNNGVDGFNPYSSLIFDGDGNLYGTTVSGGKYYYGTVFEITP